MTTTLYDTDGSPFDHGFEVLLTPKDAAAILAINPLTLNKWAKQGRVRHTRTAGGHRRYPMDAIRALHEGRPEDAREKPAEEDMSKADYVIVTED